MHHSYELEYKRTQENKLLDTLILKYLNDTISDTEREELMAWLQNPENQLHFKEFIKINHHLNKQPIECNPKDAFKIVQNNISGAKSKEKNTTIRKLFPSLFKYAAVFAGVALIGYSIYSTTQHRERMDYSLDAPQITLQLDDGSIQIVKENAHTAILDINGKEISRQEENKLLYSSSNKTKELIYNTLDIPYGKTFKVELSDGTLVTLNSGTRFKYPAHFIEDNNRTVFLDGEAFFEVTEDSLHPFVVKTTDMDVQVLGTKFNVSSYLDDQKAFTVLVDGKVLVSNTTRPEDTAILSPNQKVSLDNNILDVKETNVDKYVAWVQGQLIFKEDSFKVIANKLERKFNLKIVNNYPDLEEINITASFRTENIDQVLKTFQTYKGFDYSIKNNVITINKPD